MAETEEQELDPTTSWGSAASYNFINNLASTLGTYAETSFTQALNFLSDIGSLDITTPHVAVHMNAPEKPDVSITQPNAPSVPTDDIGFISGPSVPTLQDVSVEMVDFPSLSASSPTISQLTPPSVTWPDDPGAGPELQTITSPDAPVLTFPDAPSLDTISIPDAPAYSIPTFDPSGRPTDDLTPPSNVFVYDEPEYVSPLRDELQSKILTDLEQGGTGLGDQVEQAMWQRAISRMDDELDKRLRDIDSDWAARGFDMPPAMMAALRQEAMNDINKRQADTNRDITVEQARLARDQAQFILDRGLQMEKALADHFNITAQRSFEVARSAAEFAVNIFNAKVSAFNAKLARYQADVAAYREQVQGEMAKIQAFREELEGKRIKAEVQNQLIALYQAQLGAVQTKADVYKAQVEAAAMEAEIEKLKIDRFRSEIEAYTSRVQANTSRYQAYQSEVEAQRTRVELYGQQVQAYGTEVQAKKTEFEGRLQAAQLVIEENKNKLAEYEAEINQYNAELTAYNQYSDNLTRRFGVQSDIFRTKVEAENEEKRRAVEAYQAMIEEYKAHADVAIQNARLNAENMNRSQALALESMRNSSSVASQLAASAMTAINASVSFGYTGGENYSLQRSYSESESTVETTQTSTSTQEIYHGEI